VAWTCHAGTNEIVLDWYIRIRVDLVYEVCEFAEIVVRRVRRYPVSIPARKVRTRKGL